MFVSLTITVGILATHLVCLGCSKGDGWTVGIKYVNFTNYEEWNKISELGNRRIFLLKTQLQMIWAKMPQTFKKSQSCDHWSRKYFQIAEG